MNESQQVPNNNKTRRMRAWARAVYPSSWHGGRAVSEPCLDLQSYAGRPNEELPPGTEGGALPETHPGRSMQAPNVRSVAASRLPAALLAPLLPAAPAFDSFFSRLPIHA